MKDSTTERLAERIKKLLALAGNNPSEAEAAAALERASAIMAEHNLTMTEVETFGSGDERVQDQYTSGDDDPQTWARMLWDAVAQLNFCFYSYYSRGRWRPT